ncbi:MAG: glutaminyl-peptide cyclotransferase [Sphingobacteriales bacterium]|nr:MAG: glutaminyl-peptide cyclotransferase [Sphingobacteriales bacterium]
MLAVSLQITSCKNEGQPTDTTTTTTTDSSANNTPAPAQIEYQLLNKFPHDGAAFTEGLQYVDGFLYEGVGRYGKSDVRKTDLKTGKVLQQQTLDKKYFGEGITVLNGKIYQLTYQERTGFVYDQKTMKLLKTFPITTVEGWGMTTDGTNLIYGDGTSTLYFLDPNTLQEVKHISVTDQFGTVSNINELEYIKGFIYANQWQTDLILKINPADGKIVAVANLATLREHGGIPSLSQVTDESMPEVLNGIAYDATGNRIFVTGKNWPSIFEIKLDN